MSEAIELLQFPYSHYNEKVRWALDLKEIEHRRTNLVPGPHAATTLRLTGQTQVPIVRFGAQVVHGSAAIIDELESRFPHPPLYPEEPAARDRALDIQRYFDEEIGPMVRRGIFAVLTQEAPFLASMFANHWSPLKQRLYVLAFPLTRAVMKQSMGISDRRSIEEGIEGTEAGLDFVAREVNDDGFLVTDRLSIADIAAASLLAPAVSPPDSPMCLPEPRPVKIEMWLEKWRDHAGAAWVRSIYQRSRKTPGGANG